MRRTVLAAAALLAVSSAADAQSATAAGAPRETGSPGAGDVTFPASKDLAYRVAWGVNVGPGKPDGVPAGFRSPASFLSVGDANGVPRQNVHLALVVWGTATHSLLTNEAYRRARGADNASVTLLQSLHDAGVQVIVCGEALRNRSIDRADLLPFVKVAPTATMALATLHAQGYGILRP